jgi:hypothetical protein
MFFVVRAPRCRTTFGGQVPHCLTILSAYRLSDGLRARAMLFPGRRYAWRKRCVTGDGRFWTAGRRRNALPLHAFNQNRRPWRLNANKGLKMKCLLVCSALVLAAAAAQAQNPQPAAPENPTVQVAPQNSPSPPPERIAPSGGTTLSEQLSKGRGTVEPPKNVDPGMTVTPPTGTADRMSVIPPQGSAGGKTPVVPK